MYVMGNDFISVTVGEIFRLFQLPLSPLRGAPHEGSLWVRAFDCNGPSRTPVPTGINLIERYGYGWRNSLDLKPRPSGEVAASPSERALSSTVIFAVKGEISNASFC